MTAVVPVTPAGPTPAAVVPVSGPNAAAALSDLGGLRDTWLRQSLRYAARQQAAALLFALPCVALVICEARLYNYAADLYHSRGLDMTARGDSAFETVHQLTGTTFWWLQGSLQGPAAMGAAAWNLLWMDFLGRAMNAPPQTRCWTISGLMAFALWIAIASVAWIPSMACVGFTLLYLARVMCNTIPDAPKWFRKLLLGRYLAVSLMFPLAMFVLAGEFFDPDAGEGRRALLRLLALPVLQELATVFPRLFAQRQTGSDWLTVLWLHVVHTGLGTLGRVLLFGMTTTTGTVFVVVGSSAVELLMRNTLRRRDRFYCRVARMPFSAEREQFVRAADVGTSELCEISGIPVAAALTAGLRLGDATVPAVLASTAFQLLVELATDLGPAIFVWWASPNFADAPPMAKRRGAVAALAARMHANLFTAQVLWDDIGQRRHAFLIFALQPLPWVSLLVSMTFAPMFSICVPAYDSTREWQEWGPCE